MPVLDLSAYKPVPATLGDANQVANGFQATQNAINALDNLNFAAGKIFDPAKLMQNAAIDGDPLVWDNSLAKWVPASTLAAGRPRAPRVVVSTMAGGPPASPVDQDIWIATAVDANGTRWAFQYNAGSASAFKWESISGVVTASFVATGESQTPATGVYAALATAGPSITVARAGDYLVTVASEQNASAGDNTVHSFDVGGTGAVDADGVGLTFAVSGWFNFGAKTTLKTGLAASTAIVSKYKATNTVTTTWRNRMMTVVPVRVA